MNASEGRFTRDEVQRARDKGWKCLGKRTFGQSVDERLRELFNRTARHSVVLHPLRRGVIRLHTHFIELQIGCLFYLRMGELIASSENNGLAEDDVFGVYGVGFVDILCPTEPH